MKSHLPSSGWRTLTLCFVFALPVLAASGPELTVQGPRGEKAQLAIESIETDIFFYQDLSETILTITFENPENRVVEGEFAIPLPPGATVSSYALDVNGAMREGVVVEKERARHAYESIKRQMIDPGFIEREPGNVYRTKIFPIPSRGTKSVRLGYCEILPSRNGKSHYRLPLPENISVKKFQATIEHGENKTVEISALGDFAYPKTSVINAEFTVENATLGKELAINFEAPKPAIINNGGNYSYLRQPLTEELKKTNPRKFKQVEIYWDCSESGNFRDHKRELALLDAFFQKHPKLDVTLNYFHQTKEPGGLFRIKNGNWSKLRTALTDVLYDGATNFSLIEPTADLTLVFSDGINSALLPLPLPGKSCLLVNSSGNTPDEWHSFVKRSDGKIIDLTCTQITEALEEISQHPLTIVSEGLALIDGSFIRLFQASEDITELQFQRSGSGPKKIPIPRKRVTKPRSISLMRKLWAQQKLRDLEAATIPDRSAIISHSKEHGLVSSETSLIVLDRFQDYVRYEIPPPEEALQKKYTEALAKKGSDNLSRFASGWRLRSIWHAMDFPWQDHILIEPIRRIAIWHKSLRSAFEEQDLDPEAVGTITRWKLKALSARKSREALSDHESYLKWLGELALLKKQEREHQEISPQIPKGNEKMAVSLRGFVGQPGTYRLDPKLTLQKALVQAGGIDKLGTAAGVAIYRNASKTIYNTLSKDYRDIPLRNGDMVVVLQNYWDDYHSGGDSDPFSSGPSTPPNPRERPSIVKERPRSQPRFLGPSQSFSGPSVSKNITSSLVLAKTEPINAEALTAFDKALAKGLPAIDAYAKLRGTVRHDDTFYISVGTTLRKHGYQELAHRVLSNLAEESKPRPAGFRKWAYALVKIGEGKRALQKLQLIANLYPDDSLLLFDQAWLSRKLHPEQFISPKPTQTIATQDSRLGEISAASLYGKTKNLSKLSRTVNAEAFPVDLRIVVSNTSGQGVHYEILDPSGLTNRISRWGRGFSQTGGRLIGEKGVAEFMIKNAIPGDYQLSFVSPEPEILRVEIYRNWGQPKQTLEEHLLPLSGSPSRQEIFTYSLKFQK